MPFTKELGKDFNIVNDQIVLSDSYKNSFKFKPKKITATRFSAVLGKSAFTSPFKVWCDMVKIYAEQPDPLVTRVGEVFEPKIRNIISKQLGVDYKSYVPKDVNWDIFQDVEILGGIPDGEPQVNGKVDYSLNQPLLEIKTSSIDKFSWAKEKGVMKLIRDENGFPKVKTPGAKKLSWFNDDGSVNVPEEYRYQIGLYLYLRNQTKGLIVCCFAETGDYLNPEAVDVSNRKIVGTYISINRDALQKQIDYAIEWYNKYIKTGISPRLTEKDKEWLKEVELLK